MPTTAQLDKRLKVVEADVAALKSQMSLVQSQLASAQTAIMSLGVGLTQLQNQVSQLQVEVAQIPALAARLDKVEADIVTMFSMLNLPATPGGNIPIPTGPPATAEGFTVFTPHATTQIIYVDATGGNDVTGAAMLPSNPAIGADPFNPVTPGSLTRFQTVAGALAELATLPNNSAHWILFLKGETWNEDFGKLARNGVDADNRLLFSSWDDGGGGPPPRFVKQISSGNSNDNVFWSVDGGVGPGANFVALVDLDVIGNGNGSLMALTRGRSSYILFEACKLHNAEINRNGTVTTANGAGTTLIDSAATFQTWNVHVGDVVENLTDGSAAIVRSINSQTQITHDALAGGAENDWDSADSYVIHSAINRGNGFLFQNNSGNPVTHHVTVFRCIVYDNGMGTLCSTTDDLTFDQCVYDHNGAFGASQDVEIRTHNKYLSVDRNRTTVQNCISLRASGFCQKLRGPWTDNFAINNCYGRGRNAIDVICQGGPGIEDEINTNGAVQGNAIFGPPIVGSGMDGIDINATHFLTVTDNVLFRTVGFGGNAIAIRIMSQRGRTATGPWTDNENITITNNRIYEWEGDGIGFVRASSVPAPYDTVTINNNDIDMPAITANRVINHQEPLSVGTGLTLSGNRYWSDNATSLWFSIESTDGDYTFWSGSVSEGSTPLGTPPTWVDASRTLETYNAYDGGGAGWPTGPASEAHFVMALRAITKDTWHEKYQGENMAQYFKDGYTIV